jgi:hypothetical protein
MSRERSRQAVGWQRTLRLGVMAVLAAGLTACGGQEASQPATSPPSTSLPAPTESVPATAASSPAATAVAGGTPIAAVNLERLAADCADYNAWRNNPDVQASLEKMALWPAVIAEGEKAAAGQPVDKAAMQQDFDQMDKLGKRLRTTNLTEGDHAPLQLAGRAMGSTSRLAGGLATGTLDQQAAGEAVAAAKTAIAAYQEDAAAREAACASVG